MKVKFILTICIELSLTLFSAQVKYDYGIGESQDELRKDLVTVSTFQKNLLNLQQLVTTCYFTKFNYCKEEHKRAVSFITRIYPPLRHDMVNTSRFIGEAQIDTLLGQSDSIVLYSNMLVKLLNSEESYEVPEILMSARVPYERIKFLSSRFNRELELTLFKLEKLKSEREYQELLRKKITIIILISSVVIVLVLLLSYFLVAKSRRKIVKQHAQLLERNILIERQKQIVQEKNEEITKSIEYALRIQSAILPPTKIVKEYLVDSFILYKPKDIVAGDFYWMETVGQTILFAACDCTGHGVPGALVSVVCHNALNRAVREFTLVRPSLILDKAREIVVENFIRSEEAIQDGMDISLCAFNPITRSIEWSGANNPLWIISGGELKEIKADKQPVGRTDRDEKFTNFVFTLNKGDTIYLFTDGYADQFGGENGKKLTRKRFKELLLSIQNQSMDRQRKALDEFIATYKGTTEQIDDILVFGVRVS